MVGLWEDRAIPLASLLLGAASLTGCATVTTGTDQSVTVITELKLEGARCELTDKKGGKWYLPSTPGSITVRKGDGPMTVVCRKEGYRTGTVVVDESLVGATFGNIILGGGIGILVDAASGAAQQYPDQIVVWMEPLEWGSDAERSAWEAAKAAFDREQAERTATASPDAAASQGSVRSGTQRD